MRKLVISTIILGGLYCTVVEMPTDKEMDYQYEYVEEPKENISDSEEIKGYSQGWINPNENND